MSANQNKVIVRRFIEEVMSQGNSDLVDELMTADFIEHEEVPPGTPPGLEGFKQLLTHLHDAFPDFKTLIHDVIAENDKVVVYFSWQGRQQGPFMGMPPSGKRISIDVFDIFRLADGKIVEHWGLMDRMTMMQQLGAIPTS